MGLPRREAALKKNASVAAADAVLVAEAVSYYYPKMVQLHSYGDHSNVAGRLSNWRHLNTKVLKAMHCDLSEEQMMRFANRQSDEEVVEYLRELRVRLPSFEPLYLAEFHVVNDAASQKMSSERMARAMPQRAASFSTGSVASDNASVLTDDMGDDMDSVSSTSSFATASSSSAAGSRRGTTTSSSPRAMGTNLYRQGSGGGAGAGKGSLRRPSTAMNNQLLGAREGRKEVSRRASLMTSRDIDEQFKTLSGKIKVQTTTLASETDELNRKSHTLDAQMAALQKQNQNEMVKIDKRLSVLRLEQTEAETGKSVAIGDDVNYTSMVDPSKNSFAQQLSQSLREAAMEMSSLDHARGVFRSPSATSRSKSMLGSQSPVDFPKRGEEAPRSAVPFSGGGSYSPPSQKVPPGSEEEEYYSDGGSSMYRYILACLVLSCLILSDVI
jgi:hypothetical protein